MKHHHILVASLFFLTIALSGCTPFSDFQTAKTVGKGNIEVTPFAATRLLINNVGVNVDVGVTDNFDLRATYAQVFYTTYGQEVGIFGNVNSNTKFISLAPKISIIKNIVAFTVPFDYMISNADMSSEFVIRPTLLATVALNKYANLTFSPKSLIVFTGKSNSVFFMPALSIGLSLNSTNRITFKPEIGISSLLDNSRLSPLNCYIGLGMTFRIEKGDIDKLFKKKTTVNQINQ